jgi:hypothetical protein
MNSIMFKIATYRIKVIFEHMFLEMKVSLLTSISDCLGENSVRGKVTNRDEKEEKRKR